MRVAGVMSGTSLDGIDVAIVDFSGPRRFRTVAFRTTPYPEPVRQALLGISNTSAQTGEVARLHFLLGELYAAAVRRTCQRAGVKLSSVELVGCHGQTVFHEGARIKFLGHRISSTLQIGEAAVVAERLGIPVISDFRQRDIAAGGRGAPLVPYVDYLLFRHPRRGRVALNIGGIANVTAIPPGAAPERVIAFDAGPGNMVIDTLVGLHTRGRRNYDQGGRIARRGRVSDPLLAGLLDDDYYLEAPPKSAGREQYGKEYAGCLLATGIPLPDLIATATVLTAASVVESIERFVRPKMRVDDLIVSGGGVHNPQIMGYLAALLPDVAIATSSEFGIDVDAKEAIAFAVLAYQTWRHRPSSLPSATGARHSVVLGKITR
ncbi:MAG: anhydro-N-acetylmuramic acid kinase [Bryobacteraceae bacterium]